MKKMLFAALAAGVMSVSANAWWLNDGTINAIAIEDNKILVGVHAYNDDWQYQLNPNGQNLKEKYAALLTAKTASQTVSLEINSALIDSIIIK